MFATMELDKTRRLKRTTARLHNVSTDMTASGGV